MGKEKLWYVTTPIVDITYLNYLEEKDKMILEMNNDVYKAAKPVLKELFKQAKMPWVYSKRAWYNKKSSVTLIKDEDVVNLDVSADSEFSNFIKKYIESISGSEKLPNPKYNAFEYRMEQEKEYWKGTD